MKVIVAGGRNFDNFRLLYSVLNELSTGDETLEIVSGGARGADSLGECWATLANKPIKRFLPNWTTYGKAAGPMRNKEMANYADHLILFWDGTSPGSKSMLNEMVKLNKPVKLFKY